MSDTEVESLVSSAGYLLGKEKAFLDFYEQRLPWLFHLCFDPKGKHDRARKFASFLLGFALGLFLYEFVVKDFQIEVHVNISVSLTLCFGLATASAKSLKIRCTCLLTIPGALGRAGRSALKALLIGWIIAGPILNLTHNGKEVMRSFACSTQLAFNLTKTKYDLMFRPFKKAMANMQESGQQLRRSIDSVERLVQPLRNEIEGEEEVRALNSYNARVEQDMRLNDSWVTTDDNETITIFTTTTTERMQLDTARPLANDNQTSEYYEQRYYAKIEARCREQLSRGSERCKLAFGQAYDKCFKAVTWMAGWILCWPMKLTFACNLVSSIGGKFVLTTPNRLHRVLHSLNKSNIAQENLPSRGQRRRWNRRGLPGPRQSQGRAQAIGARRQGRVQAGHEARGRGGPRGRPTVARRAARSRGAQARLRVAGPGGASLPRPRARQDPRGRLALRRQVPRGRAARQRLRDGLLSADRRATPGPGRRQSAAPEEARAHRARGPVRGAPGALGASRSARLHGQATAGDAHSNERHSAGSIVVRAAADRQASRSPGDPAEGRALAQPRDQGQGPGRPDHSRLDQGLQRAPEGRPAGDERGLPATTHSSLGPRDLSHLLRLPHGLADAARPGVHAATAPGHRRLLLSQAREAPRALPLQREPPTSAGLSQVRSTPSGSQGARQTPLPRDQTRGALQASVRLATARVAGAPLHRRARVLRLRRAVRVGLQADDRLRPVRRDLLSRLLARRGREQRRGDQVHDQVRRPGHRLDHQERASAQQLRRLSARSQALHARRHRAQSESTGCAGERVQPVQRAPAADLGQAVAPSDRPSARGLAAARGQYLDTYSRRHRHAGSQAPPCHCAKCLVLLLVASIKPPGGDARGAMVAASGPSGILAGRSCSLSYNNNHHQNNHSHNNNSNNARVASSPACTGCCGAATTPCATNNNNNNNNNNNSSSNNANNNHHHNNGTVTTPAPPTHGAGDQSSAEQQRTSPTQQQQQVVEDEAQRKRHQSDLYIRPSWTDAAIALDQLEKGKAEGPRSVVWFRARLQDQLSQLGYFLQRHAGKVLFVAILALATFCVALKSVQVHSKVDQLWVEEGGRLEREVKYATQVLGEASASTHQLVIQTPRDKGANMLHVSALKQHLNVIKTASQVSVHLFDITWRLKDLCYAPSIPNFDVHYIDQIFDSIIPCAIITPLDCFWEGSMLLGPEYPVHIPGRLSGKPLNWTNLNPTEMVEEMKKLEYSFPYKTLEEYMKRAGITNGYQGKPCLNPRDPECPRTAPNKERLEGPDVGAELTGGCYGFAANYMHWPEELIVGGAQHNKTGHLTKAAALQTVIQLMGERELYEFWANTYKVHHLDWSQEKASYVLDSWQRAFNAQVKRLQNSSVESGPYNHYAFSTTSMNDVLGKYSELSLTKLGLGAGLVMLYAGAVLYRWRNQVRSQAGVGMAGVLLICASLAAGLGFCALLGIHFNAASTQIVPFLGLGLGVHDMYLLTHTYSELAVRGDVPSDQQTSLVLKRTGLSVLMAGLCNVTAFLAAALIPIPALRVFSLQAAVLMFFSLGAMLLVFPAMISLDLRRRRSGRSDLLCCCMPELQKPMLLPTTSSDAGLPTHFSHKSRCSRSSSHSLKSAPERQALTGDEDDVRDSISLKLTRLVARHYVPFVLKPTNKALAMLLLALADLMPMHSEERSFLTAQAKHFGRGDGPEYSAEHVIAYRDHSPTRGARPTPHRPCQALGGDASFFTAQAKCSTCTGAGATSSTRTISASCNEFVPPKNDDGGLPEFWLSLFRDWLVGLQAAFDRDWAQGCIVSERWFKNASDDGILAYKLLVQTGHVDNPIDKSLVQQQRLVSAEGIINPRAFYNYLSAWASNDALAYGASQANLRPEPRQWIYSNDHELKIPKSMPITYAQMPFYLHKLSSTADITDLIRHVRDLCHRFEERGLPNFPSGIPFTFWEQYTSLYSRFIWAVVAALGASIFVVGLLLLNIWASLLVGFSLVCNLVQLIGIMGLFGIQLSAVSAVLLIVSLGIGVHFTVHISLSFVTSVGSRDRRIRLAIEHMTTPVIHGAVTIFLALTMLAFSDFEFIARYFYMMLACLIGVGLVNGLLFFPVLLSLIGSAAEIVPTEHPDRISTPTPPASPMFYWTSKPPPPPRRSNKIDNSRMQHLEPSLTTITEEPNSWHSQQEQCIIVQPEVKVETSTTYPNQVCTFFRHALFSTYLY
ncbi:unnamed protein product [Trichogramma brassicae]|uniref:SSD domain-containing protein n=1 Tax=Trichogramma brassicae TaxID=86971 RepID=A0A6H5I467_9HYME|nr:unnamed protein product [Trichogramma brassicae]